MTSSKYPQLPPSRDIADAYKSLSQIGAAVLPDVVSTADFQAIIPQLPDLNSLAGTRTLLETPVGQEVANTLLPIARAILGDQAVAVRGILFDKSPTTNWNLGFHQDTKIAVEAQHDIPGFTNWSVKESVPHCRPPVELLEQMVAIRLHLDDNDDTNGPLLISPGTHKLGFIIAAETNLRGAEHSVRMCTARAGDCVLMRPLTLHASHKSTSDRHRRVIHIEFANGDLPSPLRWAYV